MRKIRLFDFDSKSLQNQNFRWIESFFWVDMLRNNFGKKFWIQPCLVRESLSLFYLFDTAIGRITGGWFNFYTESIHDSKNDDS